MCIFERQGPTWVETAKLLPTDPADWDEFGATLALDGDSLLISSIGDDDMGGTLSESGAAYLFVHTGSTWVQSAKLLAEDGQPSDLFGLALDLEDGRALVASAFDDDLCPGNIACDSGAVYAFDLAPTASQHCACAADAPCGNTDDHGGCANSTGAGAVLAACGGASVAADDLRLVSTQMPPYAIDLFFMSATPRAATPMGDGLRCVGGTLFRFPVTQADAAGKVEHAGLVQQAATHLPPVGQITAGSTWYFQDWYRDPMGPCGTTSNVTNVVRVTFVP